MTFPQSIETDLSMRTRVYDYLWGGLPIVTSSAPGTDEIIDALWRRRGRAAEIDATTTPTRCSQRSRRRPIDTRAFVEEHQWSRTLAPLVEFCGQPRIDESKEAFGVRMHVPEQPASILDRIKRQIGGRI